MQWPPLMLSRLSLCLSLCFALLAACTDDPDEVLPTPTQVVITPAQPAEVEEIQTELETESTCPIVATEGPCAVACDPVAILDFIDPGTCVTFLCELADGTPARAGGCRP